MPTEALGSEAGCFADLGVTFFFLMMMHLMMYLLMLYFCPSQRRKTGQPWTPYLPLLWGHCHCRLPPTG